MTDNANMPQDGTEIPQAEPGKLKLSKPHPLIRRTLDIKVEKDAYGYERSPRWPGVDVRVSKAQKRNALIMLDRLFKALEPRGVEVCVLDQDYYARGTFAVRDRDDKVQLFVTEAYRKVPHVLTAKELRDKDRPFAGRIPKYDDVPTGRLTLTPGGVADLSSEEALDKLIAKAVDEVIQLLEQAKASRQAAEAQRRREYQQQKQEQEEKARVEALHKAATSFRQYRELMDYIEEVRRFGRVPDGQRKEGQTLEEWLRWAEWRARIIHPIG